MKKSGYQSYRGRFTFHSLLKVITGLLVLALILTVAAFFFLQRYLVYSSDGVRLELPFFQNGGAVSTAQPTEPPVPTESEPLIMLTPAPTQESWLHAVPLPLSALSDGTAQQQVEAAGGNAAIFDMKADDGSLAYVSQLGLAISAKASSADPGLNAVIRALNDSGLYTIARVSCFKDHGLSNADRTLAITTNSGYRWTDPAGVRWVSPTSETVRQYVADVCAELAGLGFDEILLDNNCYPTEGNLNYIKKGEAYDKAAFAAVIGDFYARTAKALEGYDVRLSVLTDGATVAEGQNALSGQTLENMLSCGGRIWLSGESDAAAQILTDAGVKPQDIVSLAEQPGGDGSSWAVSAAPEEPNE